MKRIFWFLCIGMILSCAISIAQVGQPDAHFFDYDQKAALDFRVESVKEVEGTKIQDVSYASPKGGRVPAYLVVPAGKGPFAAIIFVHWGQADRTEFLAEALLLAKAGALSLLIDGVSIVPADSPMTTRILKKSGKVTYSL